jgi:hypothetical protein
MKPMRLIKSAVLACCAGALVAAGLALVSSSPAQARPCCWVMVCDESGACYHKCVTCPKFP